MSEYAECGLFTEHWRNPPAPFNPDYRPYAEKLFTETTKAMEAEGWYDNFTFEERRGMNAEGVNLWRQMYELLKAPYEDQFLK